MFGLVKKAIILIVITTYFFFILNRISLCCSFEYIALFFVFEKKNNMAEVFFNLILMCENDNKCNSLHFIKKRIILIQDNTFVCGHITFLNFLLYFSISRCRLYRDFFLFSCRVPLFENRSLDTTYTCYSAN